MPVSRASACAVIVKIYKYIIKIIYKCIAKNADIINKSFGNYLANRKTGKVLDVEKNGKISNTEGFRKSFNKGKYYWISEDGKYIEEDIFNNRTRIIGVIEDNKYFEKYMLLAIKEKDENEFYAIYSTDWLKTNTNEFDGTQSNLFVVKYSKANI